MFCILNCLILLGICQGFLIHKGEQSPDLNRLHSYFTVKILGEVEAHNILMDIKERAQSQALLPREITNMEYAVESE